MSTKPRQGERFTEQTVRKSAPISFVIACDYVRFDMTGGEVLGVPYVRFDMTHHPPSCKFYSAIF